MRWVLFSLTTFRSAESSSETELKRGGTTNSQIVSKASLNFKPSITFLVAIPSKSVAVTTNFGDSSIATGTGLPPAIFSEGRINTLALLLRVRLSLSK